MTDQAAIRFTHPAVISLEHLYILFYFRFLCGALISTWVALSQIKHFHFEPEATM